MHELWLDERVLVTGRPIGYEIEQLRSTCIDDSVNSEVATNWRAALTLGRPGFVEGVSMDVHGALHAICSTGDGYCWYCDRKLPEAEQAIDTGWDVQRLDGDRVASIIVVCPVCQREKAELGEDGFLRNLMLRVCNTTC